MDRKHRAWRDRMFALIAERDGAHCALCKKPYQFSWRRMGLCGGPSTGGYYNRIGKSSNLELDHKVALFVGGTNEPENLWLLCRSCHRTKTNQERVGVVKAKQFEVWA